MPHCKDGYRSRRVDKIMREGELSILDVAQSVVESIRGSSDALSEDDLKEMIHALSFYKKHWTPSADRYDEAVLNLIEKALDVNEGRRP